MLDKNALGLASWKLWFRFSYFLLFFVAAAASFNGFYDKYKLLEAGTTNPEMQQTFEAMVDGTAPRPFVYRQLLPMTANWINAELVSIFPTQIEEWSNHVGKKLPTGGRWIDSPIVLHPNYLLRYCIVYALVFLSAWASVFLAYMLLRRIGFHPAASVLAAVSMILLMPYLLTGGGYFYDYPELCFMLLSAWMAASIDWWWLMPVAALATWNKESFFFFLLTLYPLIRNRASRWHALSAIGVLNLVSGIVYLLLQFRFAHNSGGNLEVHILDQARALIYPGAYLFSLEKTYGILIVRGLYFVLLAFLVPTFYMGWKTLPRTFQQHAKLAAAINIPLYLLFCEPGELRNLSMLYVTLAVLMAACWSQWMRLQADTGQ